MDIPMVEVQVAKAPECSRFLAKAAMLWFWVTMFSTFYFGVVQVLPVVYHDHGSLVLTLQQTLCHFLLFEILVNWICIRVIQSPFDPALYVEYMTSHAAEITGAGFEIDVSRLRPKSSERNGNSSSSSSSSSSYSLPASSLRSIDGNPCKRWNRDTMYVIALYPDGACCATERRGGSGASQAERIVYPYWSWKPCVVCQTHRPPRAHHCQLCNACVLKRDHHCFFTGCCIGLRNQRHFVVFTFWSSVGIGYALVNSLAYIVYEYLVSNSAWDLVLPVTVIRFIVGYISAGLVFRVVVLYSLVWFFFVAVGFFFEEARIIRKGVTSFEEDNGIKVSNLATRRENLEAVFGKRWHLNFVVPLHFLYPPTDNGITWNHIKA